MCARENSDAGNQNSKNKHSKSKNAEAKKKKIQQNKNEKWLSLGSFRENTQAISLEMHQQSLCLSESFKYWGVNNDRLHLATDPACC